MTTTSEQWFGSLHAPGPWETSTPIASLDGLSALPDPDQPDPLTAAVGEALRASSITLWHDLWARVEAYDKTNRTLQDGIRLILDTPGCLSGGRRRTLRKLLTTLVELQGENNL